MPRSTSDYCLARQWWAAGSKYRTLSGRSEQLTRLFPQVIYEPWYAGRYTRKFMLVSLPVNHQRCDEI